MSKATQMNNDLWLKEMMTNPKSNPKFDYFYKEELVKFCKIAKKDLVNKNKKIDKAIDMLDLIIPELWNISNAMTYKIKEVKRILGDKENE